MKTLTACVVAALAVSACASAYAADANQAMVMRDFTDTVAPAQQQAYEAGLKAYNQCLREHHVKFRESTVTHETGNDYMYSTDVGPLTWADVDTLYAEANSCYATWRAQGNLHLKSDTGSRVGPVVRRYEPARGRRGRERLTDLTHRDAKLAGQLTVDVHVDPRIVQRLLDV